MNELKEGGVASFFDLSGKIALITGAGRGIGRAVALALAGAGSDVALVARSEDQLQSVAEEIQALGRRAVAFPADLTQILQQASLIEKISRTMSGIDILVNNAGINIPQDSVDVTEEAWDAMMNINLKGAFFMAQTVGKLMIAQNRGGRIINMTSQTGSVALAKRAAYCASKAGLNLVTKVLAMEWAPHEILVNAVAPTFIETELTKDFLADPDFREYALAKNLLKRFGKPDDVAAAVLYLASPAANMVTGHVLLVDAGWTAH
jgi:NAD(P)-dependent dehydrogenase (short-subunit alcohol dehydrogenase family)